jgi:hypothetical protein
MASLEVSIWQFSSHCFYLICGTVGTGRVAQTPEVRNRGRTEVTAFSASLACTMRKPSLDAQRLTKGAGL